LVAEQSGFTRLGTAVQDVGNKIQGIGSGIENVGRKVSALSGAVARFICSWCQLQYGH
jgi:hypothetical protein